jgi:hypothetical protein
MRFIFSLLLLLSLSAYSQFKWKDVSSEFGNLPSSVKVFFTKDSLNGRPFVAYYASINLKDHKLELNTAVGDGNRFTPSQYFEKEQHPLLVVNGTFFSFQTNQNLNLVIKEGKLLSYTVPALKVKNTDSFFYPTRGAIGFNKRNQADIAWTFTDTSMEYPYAFQSNPVLAKGIKPDPAIEDLNQRDQWKWWKRWTAIGGGPILVHNRKVRVTNKEEQMFVSGINDLHPRTAMGYTAKGELIVLAVQGRFPGIAEGITLKEMAELFHHLKCSEALNMDGGGSSCLLINGKNTITPSDKEGQRAVPAVFLVKERTAKVKSKK